MKSDIVVHTVGRIPVGDADNLGWDAGRGHVGGDILEDDAPGTNSGSDTDGDIAEDLCPGPDQHPVEDFRVTVAALLAGAAQGDFVENGDIVADNGGFSDNDARGVVEENALADDGGGVDVHGKDLADNALQVAGHDSAVVSPEKVGDPVSGKGLEAFEIEERGKKTAGSRVAAVDGEDVKARAAPDIGVGGKNVVEELVEVGLGYCQVAQLSGNSMCEAGLEGIVIEDALLKKRGEDGFLLCGGGGLLTELDPDGIIGGRLGGDGFGHGNQMMWLRMETESKRRSLFVEE